MIAGAIVLFNPDISLLKKSINSFIDFVDEIYLIDNSETSNKGLESFFSNNKIKYIPFYENKGIAFALKYACELAINESHKYLLTMDQDSFFDVNTDRYFEFIINNQNSDIAMFTPTYLSVTDKIVNVKYAITSGSVINLECYKLISGFNDLLFIDFVDFDLCYQFFEIKKQILELQFTHLNHRLGDNSTKKIFGNKMIVSNHSPQRMYYIYRNFWYCTHLSRDRKKYFADLKLRYFFVDIVKLLLFEDNKKRKIKAIKKGISDAKNGILGKISI